MTATATHFALIGRSFPSDAFQDLYVAAISQRAERRHQPGVRMMREARAWGATGEPIVLPARLRN